MLYLDLQKEMKSSGINKGKYKIILTDLEDNQLSKTKISCFNMFYFYSICKSIIYDNHSTNEQKGRAGNILL